MTGRGLPSSEERFVVDSGRQESTIRFELPFSQNKHAKLGNGPALQMQGWFYCADE